VPAGDYAVTTWVMGRDENAQAVAAWEKRLPTGEAAEVSAPDCASGGSCNSNAATLTY